MYGKIYKSDWLVYFMGDGNYLNGRDEAYVRDDSGRSLREVLDDKRRELGFRHARNLREIQDYVLIQRRQSK